MYHLKVLGNFCIHGRTIELSFFHLHWGVNFVRRLYESSMIFGDKQRNQFKKFSTWILFWLWKLENNTQLRKLCHDSKFTFNDLFTHTKTWLIKTCANSGQVTRKTNHKT